MDINHKTELINNIKIRMSNCLDKEQMNTLDIVLLSSFKNYEVTQCITDLVVYDNRNEQMIEFFLGSLKLAGKAPGTIQRYSEATHKVIDYLGKPYEQITELDMMYYFAQLSKTVKKKTYNNYRTYTNQFFRFLQKKGYIPTNPMEDIQKVKEDSEIVMPFNDAEIEKMKQSAKSLRDLAIIATLLSTGCRVGELCSMNRADIHGDEMLIYGQKGKQWRTVYLNDVAQYHIKNYLDTRTDSNPALFVTLKREKNGSEPSRITESGIQAMCRKLSVNSGVEDIHPHRFRHTLATRLENKGMTIQEIAAILGHKNIETTRIYFVVNNENLKLKHKMFS